MNTKALALAVALALGAAPASAQYRGLSGFSFNNPVSASIDTMLWTRMNARLVYRVMLKKRGYTDAQLGPMSTAEMERILGGTQAALAASRQAPPAAPATGFKPSKGRLLVPALAASLTKDKEQQKALASVFEAGLQGYAKETEKEQLATDLGGGIAFFIACAYAVVNDGSEPPDEGVTALARQLQQALDTPQLRKVSDADKQRFFELLVSLGTWLLVTWQQAANDGDAALQASLKQTAGDVLRGYLKLEPQKVRITAAGLELAQ